MNEKENEVIQDNIKGFFWEKEVGTITNIGNSVELVRKARKELSKKITKDEKPNL